MDNNNNNAEAINPNAEQPAQPAQEQPTTKKKVSKWVWVAAGIAGVVGGAVAAICLCTCKKEAAEAATEGTEAALKALLRK